MFKETFKKYKSKCPPPDLTGVIDFRSVCFDEKPTNIREGNIAKNIHMCGLQPVSKWKVTEIESNPGLIHIDNPFTALGHRYWICRSLSSYTQRPDYVTNLDGFGDMQQDEDWWETCNSDAFRAKHLLPGMRWATMGYHHNWNTKVYSEDLKGPFPKDLSVLCHYVAVALGFPDFKAEAAIVNFYNKNSALAGHTDNSERNLDAPLFSFSFGCTAIFLMGGKTLEVVPTAMFLHSGDLVTMSGESRLCYHSVPKIIQKAENLSQDVERDTPCKSCSTFLDCKLYEKCSNNEFWEPYKNYVEKSRINLNVRQVLYPGETVLTNDT